MVGITTTVQPEYQVRETVLTSEDASYDLFNNIVVPLETTYDIRSSLTSSEGLSYDILNRITTSVDSPYDLLDRITTHVDSTYHIAMVYACLSAGYDLRRKVSDEIFEPIGGACFPFQIVGGAIPDDWAAQANPVANINESGNIGHRLHFRHIRSRPPFPDTRQTSMPISGSIQIPFIYDTETTLVDFSGHDNIYPFRLHSTSGETYQHPEKEIYDIGISRNYWIKSWLSPPVKDAATLSAGTSFTLKGGFTTNAVSTAYGSYVIPVARPAITIFVWDESDNLKKKLTEKVSGIIINSNNPRYSYKNYFIDETIGEDVTLSSGDRIGVELTIRSGVVYGHNEYGFAYDGSAIDGTQLGFKSYIDFTFESPSLITFKDEIQADVSLSYDIRANMSTIDHDMYFGYNNKVSTLLNAEYNIRRGGSYFDIETHSSLRGQASLFLRPEYGSLDAGDDFWDMIGKEQYYRNRWASQKASLNEFRMIEDFERFTTLGELTSSDLVFVTDSAEAGTLSFYKTYSAMQNFSDYNYLSVLSKAENPTAMYAVFHDASGRRSFPINLAMKQERGRYESEIWWLGADPRYIKKAEFFFEYNGWLILDDIALIKAKDGQENTDWIPILLEDMDYSRQIKFNSIKIPEGGGEIFQHFGEYNAEGVLNMRSFDNHDALYLKTVLKDRRPIFLRLKNDGFPIYLSKYEVNMVNQSSRSIQSEITAWFTEVYDSSL
jgi:hypothetical protein